MSAEKNADIAAMSFETAIAELESIVQRLEKGRCAAGGIHHPSMCVART